MNSLKPIGGYFELESGYSERKEYYPEAIALNSGRNALEYLIKIRNIRKIYLPSYICHSVIEKIDQYNIKKEFYHIDEHLSPVLSGLTDPKSTVLFINFFGLKQDVIIGLRNKIENLIVDNSQAFFCPPATQTDTFYSCRKFFGVPDGAYLFTSDILH
jgi:hypothetical protein